jgi:cytochrome bd-type quinol oxidase subunit 2
MLSQQALILSICNVVIFIALIISVFIIKKTTDKKEESKYKIVLKNIAALIFFLIIMIMQVYSVNCMVYGECGSWAWIITIFTVLGTLAYLGLFIYILIKSKTPDTKLVVKSES